MKDLLHFPWAFVMPTGAAMTWPIAVALALVAAALMLVHTHRGERPRWLVALGLVPLAAAAVGATQATAMAPALVVGLVVATLVRRREDPLHSECALKLLWVLGAAIALSWAGRALLVIATGTSVVNEQWAVLAIEVEPPHVWRTGLPLSLLLGLVLLGSAPFHFWASDLFHGARPWIAPLAVASLQVTGAGWLVRRTEGIGAYPAAAHVAEPFLGIAATVGFVVGAATLLFQRRPERRVGTLASLNGTLAVAAFVGGIAGGGHPPVSPVFLGAWAAHLVLALTAAGIVARFLPVSGSLAAPVLMRRHPWTGIAGLYAMLSLAGAPGTPGARMWLESASSLVLGGRAWLTIGIAAAWLTAFGVAVRQAREAFGVRDASPPPERDVPRTARAAIWVCALGLVAMMVIGR